MENPRFLKVFHYKNKFTQYLFTNPALQRIVNVKHKGRETTCKKKQESNILSTNPKEDNHTKIRNQIQQEATITIP